MCIAHIYNKYSLYIIYNVYMSVILCHFIEI